VCSGWYDRSMLSLRLPINITSSSRLMVLNTAPENTGGYRNPSCGGATIRPASWWHHHTTGSRPPTTAPHCTCTNHLPRFQLTQAAHNCTPPTAGAPLGTTPPGWLRRRHLAAAAPGAGRHHPPNPNPNPNPNQYPPAYPPSTSIQGARTAHRCRGVAARGHGWHAWEERWRHHGAAEEAGTPPNTPAQPSPRSCPTPLPWIVRVHACFTAECGWGVGGIATEAGRIGWQGKGVAAPGRVDGEAGTAHASPAHHHSDATHHHPPPLLT
jgi:hypothetical protein